MQAFERSRVKDLVRQEEKKERRNKLLKMYWNALLNNLSCILVYIFKVLFMYPFFFCCCFRGRTLMCHRH